MDEFGDFDIHRTICNAEWFLALQAALSFFNRQFGGIAQGNFEEVVAADMLLLLRHLPAVQIDFWFGFLVFRHLTLILK
jgi:hypothetical protein